MEALKPEQKNCSKYGYFKGFLILMAIKLLYMWQTKWHFENKQCQQIMFLNKNGSAEIYAKFLLLVNYLTKAQTKYKVCVRNHTLLQDSTQAGLLTPSVHNLKDVWMHIIC